MAAATAMAARAPQGDSEKAKREALLQLCHANGIREEDVQRPERVTSIEMVLDDYCSMQALQYFSNLRSICLIQQAISKVEGLENCSNLERLVLNENRVEKVEGLESCPKLKQLYLCSNQISELGAGLTGLRQLEVLWVAENQLTSLQGMAEVPALTELNASRNGITSVVHAFDGNTKLRSLNLSDNRICSFREILDMERLPNLRELSFVDPDWGENPICFLCNYRTYTLFHLPSLQIHDRMRVSEEERQAAEAAFAKKRMYYNMRIKLTKRHAADGLRMAKAAEEEHGTSLARELEAVTRVLKQLDACTLAQQNPPDLGLALDNAAEQSDRAAAERLLRERQTELTDAAMVWDSLLQSVHAERDALIRGLMLELQTGGNIRMEHGSLEQDPWARQVEELVKTRFRAEEFARFGIAGLKVHSVTRVHNRSLRIRFDELLDRMENDARHQVEYLFYVPEHGRAAAEVRAAAEEDLCIAAASSCPSDGCRGPSLLLTNSVSLVEGPRLEHHAGTEVGQAVARAVQHAAQQPQEEEPGPGGEPKLPGGTGLLSHSQGDPAEAPRRCRPPGAPPVTAATCCGLLLVCSAYLAEQLPDDPANFDGATSDVRGLWAREPSCSAPSGEAAASGYTLYRSRADDPRQKVWQVSKPELVLPEYLVELDYSFADELVQPRIPARQSEQGPFSGLIRDYLLYAALSARKESQDAGAESAPPLPFHLPELSTIEKLDDAFLRKPGNLAGASLEPSALSKLRVLNLHGRGIWRIDPAALEPLSSLEALLLSFNSLESISCMPRCHKVTHLDISFNLLQKVTTLGAFPALTHLDMSWNSLLQSIDVMSTLVRDVPQVEVLAIAGNPMAKGFQARAQALTRLKCLKTLDGREVSPDEVLEAQASDMQQKLLTEAALMDHSFTSATCLGPTEPPRRHLSLPTPIDSDTDCYRVSALLGMRVGGSGSGGGSSGSRAKPSSRISRVNWRGYVESADLRGLGLTDLCDLSGLMRIRRLDLGGNQLASLDSLAVLTSLEELSAEQNMLASLHGVGALPELRRLDAGSNQITDVLDLSRLAKLSQLSLEDNYIDSLDTFAMLHSLMELFLSNNLIEELRAVLLLKQLPKLVVLDLSGNELCSTTDYRRYTIFHLRRLKVLDGIPITQAEQQEADEQFSGRITMELLEDKLGPSPSCYNFRSVDLSNQGLRELGQLLNDDVFPYLRELSLDGNPLTSVRELGPLSKLLVLRMNKTRVDLEHGVVGEADSGCGIASLSSLQVLELGSSGIADMAPFAQLPLLSLRILHLPGNEIARVEGISHLEQLRELVLDKNRIKQFDEHSFEGLRSLRELRVEDNGLKSLANLRPVPRLRCLYLSLNRIAELAELEHLRALRHVLLIHLSQNPVARKPLYRTHLLHAVFSLRCIDGKEVTEEERGKVDQLQQVSDLSKPPGQGCYVFTEQPPGAPMTHMMPPVADMGLPKTGAVAIVGLPNMEKGSGAQGGQEGQRQQAAETSARASFPAQSQPSAMVKGQGICEPTPFGLGGGEDPRREVGGCGGAALSRRTGPHGAGASGGEVVGGAIKKTYAARSHSLPRHVGLESRSAAMPPSSGR